MRVTTYARNMAAAMAVVAGMAGAVRAGTYEPTMWVYCTFYDYHANETNPNFQPAGLCASTYDKGDQPPMNANGGVRPNMVMPTLGADRKPTINPANIHQYHNRLNDWFRPQGQGSATFSVTSDFRSQWTGLQLYQNRPNEYVGPSSNASDPMFNIVIYDSLQFSLVNAATGTYEYRRLYNPPSQPGFFPLDGRGFGTEPTHQVCFWHDPATAQHNYSFAMEIHRSFTYSTDLTFTFEGDDDVWCFINNQLVMDIGGIHGPIARTINLNSLGLTPNQTYPFDFFYCERNVTGSDIIITTNIISRTPPRDVRIYARPDTTLWEGDTVTLSAEVIDDQGNPQPGWASGTGWRVENPTYPNPNQLLTSTTGAEVKFIASAGTGGNTFLVTGRACNPADTSLCREASVSLRVLRPELRRIDLQPPTATVQSGGTVSLTATVYDNYRNGNRNVTAQYGPKVQWTVVLAPDSGDHLGGERVSPTSGAATTFYGYRAYNCYLVIGTVTDTTNSRVFRDTTRICVTPGPAYQIVVEGDTIIAPGELRDPHPQGSVTLNSSATSATVAAIVRDSAGNFVRLANRTSTTWTSSDSSIARVRPRSGAAMIGDISRVTIGSGSTVGTAREGTLRPGTVNIQVAQGEVTALFFVNPSTGQTVTSVTIWAGDTIPLRVDAVLTTGDTVRGWNSTWTLRDVTSGGAAPPSNAGSWVFRPNAAGTGQICASSGTVNTCVPVTVQAARLIRIDVQPPSAGVQSGGSVPLTATVYDNYGLGSRDVTNRYGPKVQWTVVVAPDSGDHLGGERVSPTSGAVTTFYGYRAYNCYLVIGTVTDTTNQAVFRDTARICVSPGEAYQIVVEGDTVISSGELRDPNPQGQITLNASATSASVAAIVRDSVGNFVRLASRTATTWSSSDTTAARVRAASGAAMVGQITRVTLTSGGTVGTAREGNLRPGSVQIIVVEGQVTRLFFVNTVTGQVVSAIDIGTDDTISLRVDALLSTGDTVRGWTSDWNLTGGIAYDGAGPPDAGGYWVFRPRTPGSGTLSAVSGSVTGSVPVTVRRSPPRRAEMTLLTPDSLLIAGETLLVEVRIYNLDGLVPGTYCYGDSTPQAVYADPLGTGPGQPAPIVRTDGDQGTVNQYFSSSNIDSVRQCFVNGVDTVKFVLYYAPSNRSPHQLLVRLGSLPAQTREFVLKPGPLHHMDLTSDDEGRNPYPPTVVISVGGTAMFWAQGYDQWNNYRGTERSSWTITGNLPEPPAGIRANLWMDGNARPNGASGVLTATGEGTTVRASRQVVITGRLPQITMAETGDTNGNGYLDQIVVHFDKPVDLSSVPMATILASFHVNADEVTLTNWTVVGIAGRNSGDGTPLADTVFVLQLREQQNGYPQTAWMPSVSVDAISDGSGTQLVTATVVPVRAVDKAPPVVWQVIKVIDPSGDATKHQYIVVMSERVEAAPGTASWSFAPPDVAALFEVYTRDRTTGEYVLVPSELLGSAGNVVAKDTSLGGQTLGMVRFNLTDGASELYTHHYLNFQTSPKPIVADLFENVPGAENQHVRVVPFGQVDFNPRPIPNPAAPDARATPSLAPGDLSARHEPNASEMVKSGQWGGFALVFDLTVPDASCSQVIRVFRKIYDVAGNLVNEGVCEDLLATYDDVIPGGGTIHIQMHWDAFNSQGKPVAAGVYREVVYLDYVCPSMQDRRGVVTYGVRAR